MGNKLKNINKKLLKKTKKDYIYNSYWLQKLINNFMHDGEKKRAQALVYNSLKELKKINKQNKAPILYLFEVLELIKVDIEVTRKKIGKNEYMIPHPTSTTRQYKTALKWFIEATKSQKVGGTSKKITTEVENIIKNNRSFALDKKKKLYEIVVYFRTHLHFRWK